MKRPAPSKQSIQEFGDIIEDIKSLIDKLAELEQNEEEYTNTLIYFDVRHLVVGFNGIEKRVTDAQYFAKQALRNYCEYLRAAPVLLMQLEEADKDGIYVEKPLLEQVRKDAELVKNQQQTPEVCQQEIE